MELPLHFPSPFTLASATATAASTTASNIISTATANALLPACDEQSACSSLTNLTDKSDDINPHQLYQCTQVCDEEARISKKRKQASSSTWEAAFEPTIQGLCSPQGKVDDSDCHGVSTFKGEEALCEQEGNEEELAGGTTPPPYVQISTSNATHHHDCSANKQVNDTEDPIIEHADLEELLRAQVLSSASIGDKLVSLQEGGISLVHSIGDHHGILESMCAGCSVRRRGPPPAPRKPKAKPRLLNSNNLDFFIPPDLDLFFSSTSSPTNIYKPL